VSVLLEFTVRVNRSGVLVGADFPLEYRAGEHFFWHSGDQALTVLNSTMLRAEARCRTNSITRVRKRTRELEQQRSAEKGSRRTQARRGSLAASEEIHA